MRGKRLFRAVAFGEPTVDVVVDVAVVVVVVVAVVVVAVVVVEVDDTGRRRGELVGQRGHRLPPRPRAAPRQRAP